MKKILLDYNTFTFLLENNQKNEGSLNSIKDIPFSKEIGSGIRQIFLYSVLPTEIDKTSYIGSAEQHEKPAFILEYDLKGNATLYTNDYKKNVKFIIIPGVFEGNDLKDSLSEPSDIVYNFIYNQLFTDNNYYKTISNEQEKIEEYQKSLEKFFDSEKATFRAYQKTNSPNVIIYKNGIINITHDLSKPFLFCCVDPVDYKKQSTKEPETENTNNTISMAYTNSEQKEVNVSVLQELLTQLKDKNGKPYLS